MMSNRQSPDHHMPNSCAGRLGPIDWINHAGFVAYAREIGRIVQHRGELRKLYRAGWLCHNVRVVYLRLRIGFRVQLGRLPLCLLRVGGDSGSVCGACVANAYPGEYDEDVRGRRWCCREGC